MQHEVPGKALRLLREMNERQAHWITHARVIPHQVAHHAGLDANSDEYEETVAFLLEVAFLAPYEDEVGAFRITERGMDLLRKMEASGGGG